jgi:hypothetical protein
MLFRHRQLSQQNYIVTVRCCVILLINKKSFQVLQFQFAGLWGSREMAKRHVKPEGDFKTLPLECGMKLLSQLFSVSMTLRTNAQAINLPPQ